MDLKDMTWEEICRYAPKKMTWEELCELTRFEGSWADECEREERRAAHAGKPLAIKKVAKEETTPKKKETVKTPSPLKISLALPTTSDTHPVDIHPVDDDTKGWATVGAKKPAKVAPTVQGNAHVHKTHDPFVCPKCGTRKSQFYPLCRDCTDAEHTCPKCQCKKSPQYEFCAKCTYNCPKCGNPKSPKYATCTECAHTQ